MLRPFAWAFRVSVKVKVTVTVLTRVSIRARVKVTVHLKRCFPYVTPLIRIGHLQPIYQWKGYEII